MDFQTFLESIIAEMENTLASGRKVKLNSVLKNNSVQLTGITIFTEGENISPTIYLNEYYEQYQQGKTIGAICEEIYESYQHNRLTGQINVQFFTDFEMVKNKIVFKLVNYDKNRQLLEKIPHISFLNLAIVFYCLFNHDESGTASILIYKKHLEMWEVTEAFLYELAVKNTPQLLEVELKEIEEVMEEAFMEEMKDHYDDFFPSSDNSIEITEKEQMMESMISSTWNFEKNTIPMYVLTNVYKINGAACILYQDILHNFAQKLNSDVYILPSSIHEVILVPASVIQTKEDLERIVQEANETQVAEEEVLSDKVYIYCCSSQKIRLA